MTDHRKSSHRLRVDRVTLVAWWALVTAFGPFASAPATAQVTLQVEASHGLPGLHHSALSRFLAAHMAEAVLAEWRFEPAAGDGVAADRVEWTFRLNPYAGGEVRNFAHTSTHEWGFGVHRPVTVEARLYLKGEYQTLVEQQAVVQGGPNDPELASVVAKVTQNLLGPSGAYRATDNGRRLPSTIARPPRSEQIAELIEDWFSTRCPVNRSRPCQNSQTGHHSPS